MPHIHCYLARPSLVWSMVLTDALIGISYVVISLTLYSLVRKAKLPFHLVFLAFGLFILACGATHFMEVYSLWVPNYWLSAFVKAVTAAASIITAIYLLKLYPQIINGMKAAKEINLTRESLETYFKSKLSTPPELKRLLRNTAILPIFLAGCLAAVSIVQALYLQSSQRWVERSDEVMLRANDLHRTSIEADVALREYWLTGSKEALTSTKESEQRYLEVLSSLKDLVSGNPVQVENLRKKETIFNQWREYSSRSIAQPKRFKLSQYLPFFEEGETFREANRELFLKFVDIEQELRSKRAADAKFFAVFFIVSTVGLALIIGGIFATFGRTTLLNISSSYNLALEELKKALASRDEFVAIASHELKTPITSLKLQLELTRRQVAPDKNIVPSAERLAKVLDSSSVQVARLVSLIEELLDVSRIQAGKLSLHIEEVNLTDLINEIIERLSAQSMEAKSSIEFQHEVPLMVWGDRFRLDQVFTNLISNAIKYGAGQPIKVSAFYSSDQQKATIAVQDHGIGISKVDGAKIFERFERAGGLGKVSGLGLGLYIARQIVLIHRGEITFSSEIGQGSIFTTTLSSTKSPMTQFT